MGLDLPKKRKMVGDASFWKRGIAFLIDLLIIDFAIASPFSDIILSKVPDPQDYDFLMSNPEITNQIVLIFVVIMLLAFVYFVLFDYLLQQTPGKMLTKLYVKPEKKKAKISLLQCIIRNLAILPVFPFIILWAVDPVFILLKNRRLSEIWSKTKTIEVYLI